MGTARNGTKNDRTSALKLFVLLGALCVCDLAAATIADVAIAAAAPSLFNEVVTGVATAVLGVDGGLAVGHRTVILEAGIFDLQPPTVFELLEAVLCDDVTVIDLGLTQRVSSGDLARWVLPIELVQIVADPDDLFRRDVPADRDDLHDANGLFGYGVHGAPLS